ncbi:MAG TPA: TerB family tellurite resistance protein [Alphaproteobacteria bacterium]|nr:TerB family tellurite resistance protein [Alphaproteobacteria bacterium]
MIDRILQLLGSTGAKPSARNTDELQLAVAALLVEAARMDSHFDAAERNLIKRLLAERFKLSSEATERLLSDAEQAAERSAQLFRFTQLVVERLEPEERVRIIEMLWEVAYSCGAPSPEEDALLRRIAGLIYVSDWARGAARKRVLQRKNVAGRECSI